MALAGCGGGGEEAAPVLPADPGRALAASGAALREQGTFTFDGSFTRTLATKPDDPEEYATSKGAVDIPRRAGRAELNLTLALDGHDLDPFKGPVKMHWAGDSLTLSLLGQTRTVKRAVAQKDRGLVPRYPDEVDALDDMLAKPLSARVVDTDDGATHYSFAFDAKEAGRLGIPAELSAAFEQALYGPRLQLEAWIEDDGLPHKISYAIHLKPTGGDLHLPARTVRVTYELDDFGEDFDPQG